MWGAYGPAGGRRRQLASVRVMLRHVQAREFLAPESTAVSPLRERFASRVRDRPVGRQVAASHPNGRIRGVIVRL